MTSLANEIAKFSNPAPDIGDPEDDINIETVAKLGGKSEPDDDEITHQVSSLRLKNAPLLHELDLRYAGKRISRKSFDEAQGDSECGSESESDCSTFNEEDEIESFKQQICEKAAKRDRSSFAGDHDEVSGKDLSEHSSESNQINKDDDEEEENGELEDADDYDEQEKAEDEELGSDDDYDEQEEAEDEELEGDENDFMQKFSTINVEEEVEKGTAVQKQQELWSKLCEWRIKLQKLLVIANRLPQHDIWKDFKEQSDNLYSENLNKGYKSVGKLLSNMLELQDSFSKCIADMNETSDMGNVDSMNDEEIPSDSEEEEASQSSMMHLTEKKGKKRSLDVEGYEEFISKKHRSFQQYRNTVIQKWDEKTRLSTGHMMSKQNSFNMFDQSALKQINQILQDKSRLIKRTQLKRSAYQVFGKTETNDHTSSEKVGEKKSIDQSKDCDPEIFDDDDFYRQLLKDVIETKSSVVDPLVFSKQLEIQRVRSKMKRKVDTKASKGRRIRFDPHPKMLNIMAPMLTTSMEDDACNELFKSLFGQRPVVTVS